MDFDLYRNDREPWHIIQQQPKLKQIFNQQPIVSYKKEKSLKDILVRAKFPSIKQQSQTWRKFAYDQSKRTLI